MTPGPYKEDEWCAELDDALWHLYEAETAMRAKKYKTVSELIHDSIECLEAVQPIKSEPQTGGGICALVPQ